MTNTRETSDFIWNMVESVLKNTHSITEYKNVILPFTLLKRVDDVLAFSKKDVIEAYETNKNKIELIAPILNKKSVDDTGVKIGFYNYSHFDFKTLLHDPENIENNIKIYINSFSSNVKELLLSFHIEEVIDHLSNKNLLYDLVKIFNEPSFDLSPQNISNQDMGEIFEDLIYKVVKTSNRSVGVSFTSENIIELMAGLLFNGEDLSSKTDISVYDPACGKGGMLSVCKKVILKNNANKNVLLYGQDIDPEAYVICKANMFLKGENMDNIKGPSSTLSHDQFKSNTFDYIISDLPIGADWKRDKEVIMNEANFDSKGRFKAGLPRSKNDSQLLFIQHMISKMNKNKKTRMAFITSSSPLISGAAGSGESNIRKWILENDLLESVIALPTQSFFHHIDTYIWILSNEKTLKRKNKVQLIDAREEFAEINNNKQAISNKPIKNILKHYNDFKETSNCKIFDNSEFGYTEIVIESPMQRNFQVSTDRLDKLNNHRLFYKLDLKKQKEIKQALQTIPHKKFTDREEFRKEIENALKSFEFKEDFINFLIIVLSKHDKNVEFERDENGTVIPDPELRERMRVPLKNDVQEYFKEKVQNYFPETWIDETKNKIGYEIIKPLMFDEEVYIGEEIFPIYELGELISLEKISENDKDYDLIFKANSDKLIYYPHELSYLKLSKSDNPIGCNIKFKKIILKDYLYCYLNSKIVLETFDLTYHNKLNLYKLNTLKIPVPSIGTQKEIVDTYWLMDEFFKEMDIWKNDYSNNILDYKPTLDSFKKFSCSIKFSDEGKVKEFCSNWRIVYQGLMWPLAYTYLKAVKGSNDNGALKSNLLVLFEFLAAFNVIILISGINNSEISEEDYKKIKDELWELFKDNEKTWHMMHFGGWTTLYKRLKKTYKKYEFTTPINEKLFKELSSKKYEKLFQKLRAKERNSEAHGGLEDDIDIETKLDDLKAYLNTDIFNILNLYSGIKLYYVIGPLPKTIAPNINEYSVLSLEGPCDYPSKSILKCDKELDDYSLYLYDPIKKSYLKLDDDLIKFKLINNSKQYAVFIYDKIDTQKNVAIYKCYHQKNEFMEVTLDSEANVFNKVSKKFLTEVLRL